MTSAELQELEKLDTDLLLEMKLQLEGDLKSIRTQIGMAQRRAREDGQWADADWWHKINGAQKIKGHRCQMIQHIIHKRKLGTRTSVESNFITAARRILPAEQFQQILNEAKAAAGGW